MYTKIYTLIKNKEFVKHRYDYTRSYYASHIATINLKNRHLVYPTLYLETNV